MECPKKHEHHSVESSPSHEQTCNQKPPEDTNIVEIDTIEILLARVKRAADEAFETRQMFVLEIKETMENEAQRLLANEGTEWGHLGNRKGPTHSDWNGKAYEEWAELVHEGEKAQNRLLRKINIQAQKDYHECTEIQEELKRNQTGMGALLDKIEMKMLNQNEADNTGDARCPSSQKINTWNEMAREHATVSREAKETEAWRRQLWEQMMDAIHASAEQRSKFYQKMKESISREISEITLEDCLNAGYECHKHMLTQRTKQKELNDRLAILNVYAAQWSTRKERLKEYLRACRGSWQEISTRCQKMAYGVFSQGSE